VRKIAQLKINPDQIEFVVKIIIKIAKRSSNNSVSTTKTATAQATSRLLNIISKYEIIEELDTIAETLTIQINALKKRLERLENLWAHKEHTIKSLIKLYCKGVTDKHILYIHNFFSRLLDKIGLESLFDDLEQYASLREAREELSKEIDRMGIEISLLQQKKQSIKEKSHAIHLKLIKRKTMMRQLSERVAKAAAVFNLPFATLSTDTMLAMLSNIIHQKSEEKEKTTASKITRYTVDGKAIL
jgi:chaperonin cofactor prefoldin